jgi:ABC-2 type transport system permease protein
MRSPGAIFKRDMRKFFGSPLVIIMTFMFPLLILVVFGNTMGGTLTHLPVGVTQENLLDGKTELFTASLVTMQKDNLYIVTVYSGETSAKQALYQGRVYAVAVFPDSSSPPRPVRLYIDSSQNIIPSVLESGMTETIRKVDPGAQITIEEIYGDIKYLQFFGVAMIVLTIFMTSLLGGGTAIIQDRALGILEGYFVTPIKRSRIILGLIASGTIKAFLAACFILCMAVLLAGVTIWSAESLLFALLLIFLISLGLTSFVVSFAARFSDLATYHSTVAFFNLFLFLTAGAFYPVEGMPNWLVWISWINPENYSLHALQCVILKGQGFVYIANDILILSFFTIAAIIFGILTFPRRLDYYLQD